MKAILAMKERFGKLFLCFILFPLICQATITPASDLLRFTSTSVLDNLSSKEVQSLYQDSDGYIWISTRNGLFQYDGYSMTSYKSNLYYPDLLTSNNIYCVAEDSLHRLWIGTYNGLNVLDKRIGVVRKVENEIISRIGISRILVTRDQRILLGTENGLYEYKEKEESFLLFDQSNTDGVFQNVAVKSLFEDDRGDVWIGSWGGGLYRYEKKTGKFRKYPKMNSGNSAHVVFQDSRRNIWIGTWGAGLQLLHNAYEPEKVTWTTFIHDEKRASSISDNLIYAISEDKNTHTLWVGTRSGLSVLPLDGNRTEKCEFRNYYPDSYENSISGSEVASLLCDRQGIMWVGMIGSGVNMVNTRRAQFNYERLPEVRRMLNSNSVRSILLDSEGLLWLGISTYGFGVKRFRTGDFIHYGKMPDFMPYSGISTTMSIMQSPSSGHIWIGIYNGGAYEVDKHAPVGKRVKHHTHSNVPWICNSCIYHICEDSRRNLWFATKAGVSMRAADGTPVRIDSLTVGAVPLSGMVAMHLAEGSGDEMWMASSTYGVVRIKGSGTSLKNYVLSGYSIANGKLNSSYANCIYKDNKGRIWAGTSGSGLNLYDVVEDRFLPMHKSWNLPGDAVVSIQSDKKGNLWLGTNVGLLQLTIPDDLQEVTYRLYTTSDGLQDNIFNRGVSFVAPDGEMFFGGHRGYNNFYPDKLQEPSLSFPVVITDIKIHNRSWKSFSDEERAEISGLSPRFTDEIVLNYKRNNFSVEFSALEYANPERNQYAYKLEGFDAGWQYTDASKRFAYYNNLKSGTYTFYVKASNSNGIFGGEVRKLKVVILPPFWKTWWAYTLYIISISGIFWYIFLIVRNRIRLRNALHLREMEQAKAEEINHAKLQFFTNITHELLTPLTIISASVDELKQSAPAYKEQYNVMTHNINRLIRLLQQILEFRKAETGNLKLKVSQGDLVQFVHRSVDGFRPLMKKKEIHFTIQSDANECLVFFDPDKLDKILYNLLSNASKYNRAGGKVRIEIEHDEAEGTVRIMVKDNGPGISKEAQKDLFKRFYEGNYRKFNTIGTGIGLSLVRDLVVLHHGTITVESEEGKGTSFCVEIPAECSAYLGDEIEGGEVISASDTSGQQKDVVIDMPLLQEEDIVDKEDTSEKRKYTLLLVEDNVDLMNLMVRLLETEYIIRTATNGKEALDILGAEEIDLIVSDVMMPIMDGIELCRNIKKTFDTSHIPLILLTAKKQEQDREEAYKSGADAFITKPFNLSVLYARISNLLKARERTMRDFKGQLVFETGELKYTSLDEDFLQRAIDCVNKHLDDPNFDQTQFLEEMHTTKSTFFRKLKSLTGLSYSSFIRNIRMKAACRIIEENKRIRISELAYAVGYNDPRYFSTCFKKEIGMQPSEYIECFAGGSVAGKE